AFHRYQLLLSNSAKLELSPGRKKPPLETTGQVVAVENLRLASDYFNSIQGKWAALDSNQ
ncbi:MAG: hypothetical protein ACC645_07195, partial [Pirellulales bacterium]